jgi:hypothetical protein
MGILLLIAFCAVDFGKNLKRKEREEDYYIRYFFVFLHQVFHRIDGFEGISK